MQLEKRASALKNKEVFISCVVPVYNEEAVVLDFIKHLQQVLSDLSNRFEIIIVDDGSRDHTLAKIRDLPGDYPVKVLGLSRNFGKEIALTAGLEHCSGDVAILLDADFQHPVEVLPAFLLQWAQGYDMVYGVRQSRES
jgi:glycosyltransferase involved in cell wall biosynthesis